MSGYNPKFQSASQLFDAAAKQINEIMPWDFEELLENQAELFILDVRERDEFVQARLKGSFNVPRGILENACDYDYAETEPELINAKNKPIVVLCRSGNRSAAAALVMTAMGYSDVVSLKLGIKGWNDGELVDDNGKILDGERADAILNPPVRDDQLNPDR